MLAAGPEEARVHGDNSAGVMKVSRSLTVQEGLQRSPNFGKRPRNGEEGELFSSKVISERRIEAKPGEVPWCLRALGQNLWDHI